MKNIKLITNAHIKSNLHRFTNIHSSENLLLLPDKMNVETLFQIYKFLAFSQSHNFAQLGKAANNRLYGYFIDHLNLHQRRIY